MVPSFPILLAAPAGVGPCDARGGMGGAVGVLPHRRRRSRRRAPRARPSPDDLAHEPHKPRTPDAHMFRRRPACD